MKKNKITNRSQLEFITNSLLAISSQDYQLKVWCRNEGTDSDNYEERMLNFEADIDYLKDLLRIGTLRLESIQIREILRVGVMSRHFDEILSRESLPQNHDKLQLHIIHHPYWKKMGKQATYALSLLRSEKDYKSTDFISISSLPTEGRFRKLDDRIRSEIIVFGDREIRGQRWKNIDDFWRSAIDFNKVARKLFAGLGSLSSGHLKAFMAFHSSLDELCDSYENNFETTLKQILSDPRFSNIEQKAQDFLKLKW